MWKSVVNSINLSDKQRQEVVTLKQTFMQQVRAARCQPLPLPTLLRGPAPRQGPAPLCRGIRRP